MKIWDEQWNPVTGCTPASEGCRNCWAKAMAERLPILHGGPSVPFSKIVVHEERLAKGPPPPPRSPTVSRFPLARKGRLVCFVGNLTDLFHPDVPDDVILRVLDTLRHDTRWDYHIVTKRPDRAWRLWIDRRPSRKMGDHVTLLATIENKAVTYRTESLEEISLYMGCRIGVYVEPMLSRALFLPWDWMSCIIAGNETGPGARPCDPRWVANLSRQCEREGVPLVWKGDAHLDPSAVDSVTWTNARRQDRLLAEEDEG